MPTTFRLSGCALSTATWDALLASRPDALNDPDYSFEQDGVFHGLVVGSVRGALFKREGPHEVSVTLQSFASRMDWLLALSTLGRARLEGGGTLATQEGQVLGELAEQWIAGRAVQAFTADVQHLRAHLGPGQGTEVPIGEAFSLTLRREELPESPDLTSIQGLELRLAAKTQRFGQAYRGRNLVLGAQAKPVRLTTWAEECPTITPPGAELVSCGGLNPGQQAVPLPLLLQALGERAEDVGEGRYFLPSVRWSQEPQLASALRPLLRDPLEYEAPPSAPGAMVASESQPGDIGESSFLPVIKPRTWPGAAGSLTHPLVQGAEGPLVSYGWDRGDRVLYHPLDAANLQRVHLAGVQHLAERAQREGLSWGEFNPSPDAGLGDYRILYLADEHAPAHVILKPLMLEAHRRLGTNNLVAGIPDGQQLFVCDARFISHAFDLARGNYDEACAAGNQLSPDLFGVEGGEVKGLYSSPLPAGATGPDEEDEDEEDEDEEDEDEEDEEDGVERLAALATILAFTAMESGEDLDEIQARVEELVRSSEIAEDEIAEDQVDAFTGVVLLAIGVAAASFQAETSGGATYQAMVEEGIPDSIGFGVMQGLGQFVEGARASTTSGRGAGRRGKRGKSARARKGGGRARKGARRASQSRRRGEAEAAPGAGRSVLLWVIVILVVAACSCLAKAGQTVERERLETRRREQERKRDLEREQDAVRGAEADDQARREALERERRRGRGR